ncbi:MAG: hypothetical protein NTW49_06910 [Bacteroidia bacterium]|nr:hypothetical protein [Bacteroidia bacterium]
MKKLIKYFFISLLAVIFLIVAASLAIGLLYGDKIKGILVNELNNQITAKVTVGNIRFSLLRHFPDATLVLENVYAANAPGVDIPSFGKLQSDMLFCVRKLVLRFNALDIYHGRYVLEMISLEDGKINLFTDAANHSNYYIWKKTEGKEITGFHLELKKVSFENIEFLYADISDHIVLKNSTKDLQLSGDFTSGNAMLKIKAGMFIQYLAYRNEECLKPGNLKTRFGLVIRDGKIMIGDGASSYEGTDFNVTVSYDNRNRGMTDITAYAKDVDIYSFLKLIPDHYRKYTLSYGINGNADINFSLRGESEGTVPYHIEVGFAVSDARLEDKKIPLELKDISLKGNFSTGTTDLAPAWNLRLDQVKLKTSGGSTLSGSVSLVNFDVPRIIIQTKSELETNDLQMFCGKDLLSDETGSILLDCRIDLSLLNAGDVPADNISQLNLNGSVSFDNAGFRLQGGTLALSNIIGNCTLADNDLTTRNLAVNVSGNEFIISGTANKLIDFLIRKNRKLDVVADVSCKNLDMNKFAGGGKGSDSLKIILPSNISASLDMRIAKFRFDEFSAENMTAKMVLSYPEIKISAYSFRTMKGSMEGEAVVAVNPNGQFSVKNKSRLDHISITDMFHSFLNFGQDYLQEKHLKGFLTADINLAGIWNADMTASDKDLNMDAKVEISNGELIGFEPMMNLSKFIEVNELKDIKFSKLTNDITIHNRLITIPDMDINSSALNVSVSGVMDFDKNLACKVRVLLSDVLAKKAGKNKKENDEFGVIEDDGEGKTMLYLLISGKAGNYKVSYDTQAAKDALKNHFRDEKKEVRSILKDEFGLFKSDTTLSVPKKKITKTKKVRIEWKDEKEEPPKD